MKKMKQYILALDLKDDYSLIEGYKNYHSNVWPEIVQHIKDVGIEKLEIYNVENRLMMILQVNESFSFEKKQILDNKNEKVQEWEMIMDKFQQLLPNTKEGEKWRLMECICEIK